MKYKSIIMIFAFFATLFSACDRNAIFEREMYKARVALKGNMSGGFNIVEQEHDLDKADANGWSSGFISANVGGALPTEESIVLNMIVDPTLLMEYNQVNFGSDDYRYARLLASDKFRIPQMTITIPAGERGGIMPIQLKLEDLSPDSIYFIPFKVQKCSAYELNLEKSVLLYRIQFKNFWTTTQDITEYSHRGFRLQATQLDQEPPATRTPTYLNKRISPISKNEIRVNFGTKAFSPDDDPQQMIPKWCMRIMIEDDGNLTIEPWDKTNLGPGETLKQVKRDNFDGLDRFLNTYELWDDGFGRFFRIFRLCYDYTDPDSKIEYRMWEELKLEYREQKIK